MTKAVPERADAAEEEEFGQVFVGTVGEIGMCPIITLVVYMMTV